MPRSIRDWQHKQQRLPAKLFSARDRGGVQEPGGHRGREYGCQQSGVQILPCWVLLAHSQPQVLLEHARERREQLVRAAAVRRCARTHARPAPLPECVFNLLRVHSSSSSYGNLVWCTRYLGGYSGTRQSDSTRVLTVQSGMRYSGTGRARLGSTQAVLGYSLLRLDPGAQYLGWFSMHSVSRQRSGTQSFCKAAKRGS